MRCPVCGSKMEVVVFKGIRVDRCADCGGIWFDRMEREMLLATDGSEAIDTGRQDADQPSSDLRPADCPVCHTLMIRMVDGDSFDIWYYGCPVCRGAFLRAGEFVEYKIAAV